MWCVCVRLRKRESFCDQTWTTTKNVSCCRCYALIWLYLCSMYYVYACICVWLNLINYTIFDFCISHVISLWEKQNLPVLSLWSLSRIERERNKYHNENVKYHLTELKLILLWYREFDAAYWVQSPAIFHTYFRWETSVIVQFGWHAAKNFKPCFVYYISVDIQRISI